MSDKIYFGNPAPHASKTDGGRIVQQDAVPCGPATTFVELQPEIEAELLANAEKIKAELAAGPGTLLQAQRALLSRENAEPWLLAVGHVLEVVGAHAAQGASWVSCRNPELQSTLAAVMVAEEAPAGISDAIELARVESRRWEDVTDELHKSGTPQALKTETGVERMSLNANGTAAAVAQANYFGLTANNEAAAAAHTTLTGEITTSGGGLIRKKATYGFTKATGVATLTVTITANGTDTLPVTVNKFGVFNKAKASEGENVMDIETKLSSAVTFSVENDNVTITETLTWT